MHNKSEILAKLDEFKTFSINQETKFESDFTALMEPMISAVNAYFDADRVKFKKPLDDLGLYLHNDLWARGAQWSKPQDMGFDTNPPPEYSDFRKLFYQFPLMDITPAEFYSAWVIGTPEGEGDGVTPAEPKPLNNTLIDAWVAELSTAIADELKAIDSLGSYLEISMGSSGSVMLWEDTGALESAPTTQTLANEIFIERGLLEAVNLLGLPVYIPSYLRG